jgi:hypothetical protein
MYYFKDDGILFHQDFDQHLAFLKTIFYKLKKARLRINPKRVSLLELVSHFLASN